MKYSKQQVVFGPMVSTHLPPSKDRALANTLLRVSERAETQEDKNENVPSGGEESFYGWTNAIPNRSYTENTRPKQMKVKRNHLSKKVNSDLETIEHTDFVRRLSGVTSEEAEHYRTYSTLSDMYHNYKKSMKSQNTDKRPEIIDPDTFKYVPWDERKTEETDNETVHLPTLKMARTTKPSKLMQMLEKYVTENKGPVKYQNTDCDDPVVSLIATDMLDYYDKNYRWSFGKGNEKQNSSLQSKLSNKKRNIHIHLPSLTSQRGTNGNLEPSIKEKLVRYMNGVVQNKKKSQELLAGDMQTSYGKIQESQSTAEPGTIRLEKKHEKRNKNGNSASQWVARVIIREPEKNVKNRPKQQDESMSNSSVIIVPDTRWKRNVGIADAERERIQKETDKNHYQEQQLLKLNQLRKRLLQNSYEVDDKASYRIKRKPVNKVQSHTEHGNPPVTSPIETAKVSVKYNVNTTKKKGVVREIGNEEISISYLSRLGIPPLKPNVEKRTLENDSQQNIAIGENHVTKILHHESKGFSSKAKSKEPEQNKSGRLFLRRGAAKKEGKHKASPTNNKIKLPVLPKQAKLERPKLGKSDKKSPSGLKKENSQDDTKISSYDVSSQEVTSLPEVHGASATFHGPFNNEISDRTHTPSSSTFNTERMMQQVMDTAEFIGRTPHKNAEFIRYKVMQHPGNKRISENETSDRKPLHPPHTQNRGQEKIQDFVGQEKGIMTSVMNNLSSNWMTGNKNYPVPDELGHPDTFKAALSTAIAHAKSFEAHKQPQIPANLTNGKRQNHVIMKRRVVPPILATSVPSAPPNSSQTDAQLTLNNNDDVTAQDNVTDTSNRKESKVKRKRVIARKRNQELNATNKTLNDADKTFDDVILSGDVIVKQRPTPKLLEHSFAASITAVKPSRRIVNIIPPRIVQKG